MLEILQYGFMQKALFVGSIIAVVSAVLGIFLILKRMALIGDGLSHIAFGGVALGLFINFMPFEITLSFSVLAALGIVKLREFAKVHGDLSIGIVFSFALALGVILISLAHGFSVDLHYFLFGNIISISQDDITLSIMLGVVVLGLLVLYNKELMYVSFDEVSAQVSGIPVRRLNTLLIVLTAIVVVISIRIVGILLISSFLIIPPAAALQIARSFKQTLILAVIFSLLSVIIGLLFSFWFDLASGGSIVMVSVLFFVLSFIYKKITDR